MILSCIDTMHMPSLSSHSNTQSNSLQITLSSSWCHPRCSSSIPLYPSQASDSNSEHSGTHNSREFLRRTTNGQNGNVRTTVLWPRGKRLCRLTGTNCTTLWVKKGIFCNTFANNVGRYWQNFTILSPFNSSRNLQYCYIPQHTLNLLLHYLVK